jgi:macrolide transport system ATP-binding/permease protein
VVWVLLFSGSDLTLSYGERDVFKGLNFEVMAGERVALVGANGVGKTSLLRLISGLMAPTSGAVSFELPVRSALLNEEFADSPELTVDTVLRNTVARYYLNDRGGEALKKFGFVKSQQRRIRSLSGGEKTRLQLACVWMRNPELLLLDEPTNHLDSFHLEWLEQFIRDYRGTVVLVSHDRYFLDKTVGRVLELTPDGITSYPGNYSDYARAKRLRYEQEIKLYNDQERQAKKLRRAITELMSWSEKGHRESRRKARAEGPTMGLKEYYRAKAKKLDCRVKNNVKRLSRMLEAQMTQPKPEQRVVLDFSGSFTAGNALLIADGLSKSYGVRTLFQTVKLAVRPGEKVGLIGPNGSGKTTLLKLIDGAIEADAGSWWRSPNLKTGYLDQELSSLNSGRTILEEVAGVATDRKKIFNILAGLLFRGDEVFKPCAVLSMGERVRVALAKLLVGEYNLLMLDEPNNYLDLPSREKLEEALVSFDGAVILVSHDRYLLDRVPDSIWSIDHGRLEVFPGRYSDYLERKSQNQREASGDKRTEILRLEYKKAQLLGELSLIDRGRFPVEYQAKETEYLEVVSRLRER